MGLIYLLQELVAEMIGLQAASVLLSTSPSLSFGIRNCEVMQIKVMCHNWNHIFCQIEQCSILRTHFFSRLPCRKVRYYFRPIRPKIKIV